MSQIFTVRELIKELLEFNMDESVFIALEDDLLRPGGSAEIMCLRIHTSNITCGFGVYLHPVPTLVDLDTLND